MAENVEMTVPDPEQVIYAPGVADMYADTFQMSASPYTITLGFGLQVAPNALKPQATIRMSTQHAKVMAILFKRLLKQYEQQAGEIVIPPGLLSEKEIDLERDW